SAICWSVALMSVVCVVHIDWTETGALPPTKTLPTLICRVARRGARTGTGAAGMPRLTGLLTRRVSHPSAVSRSKAAALAPPRPPRVPPTCRSAAERDRIHEVRVDEHEAETGQQHEDRVGERHEPRGVGGP